MRILKRTAEALLAEREDSVVIRGEKVDYRLTCEETLLGEAAPEASIVSYSYCRLNCEDNAARPVLFCFNGGPGSSSLWVHLGIMGAKRVKLGNPVNPNPLPPYALEDNPHCMLDACDIVLIDPPETGYARLYAQEMGEEYLSVDGDAHAIALFIRNWLTQNGRVNSPRYLCGESYGTYRMPYVVRELMGGPMASEHRLMAVPVDGLIMLGTALTMNHEITPDCPEVYRSVLELPAFASAHHYFHPAGKPALREWINDVVDFCGGEYLSGLFAGEALSGAARVSLENRLEYYTGVSADWFHAHDCKISAGEFAKLGLAREKLDMGLYDARYTMRHSDLPGDPVADDPAMGKYTAAFAGAWEACFKQWLGISTERDYRCIDFIANGRWNYRSACGLTPCQCLQLCMRRNEGMLLMFGSGVYDLVTNFGTVRYLKNHLGLDARRVFVHEYESGHMPYLGNESAAALASDIRAIISGKRREFSDET